MNRGFPHEEPSRARMLTGLPVLQCPLLATLGTDVPTFRWQDLASDSTLSFLMEDPQVEHW